MILCIFFSLTAIKKLIENKNGKIKPKILTKKVLSIWDFFKRGLCEGISKLSEHRFYTAPSTSNSGDTIRD